jgi:hypothetical protein
MEKIGYTCENALWKTHGLLMAFPNLYYMHMMRIHVTFILFNNNFSFHFLGQSTGVYIAASRYGSATHVPPSVLSRGVGWQVGLILRCLDLINYIR